jgi:cytochrome P450
VSPIATTSLARRLKGGLPPSPRHPATVQTVGGRRWPYRYLEHCQKACGDSFTLYPLDRPPMVFLSDPQDIRAVLADAAELHPGAGGRVIAPLIGDRSFMLLEEQQHICGRRAINPAFHKRMVAEQSATLSAVVERAVASWPLEQAIALLPRIRALTLEVVLRIIFSDQDTMLVELHQRLARMSSVSDSLLLQGPRLRHIPLWRGMWRRFLKQRAEVDELVHRLIEARRSRDAGSHGDLLDMLLAAENHDGSPMSTSQIRDNLMSMILAGHETTTGELAWAFQLLAYNPGVQQRLIEELDCDPDTAYLTATVHETLRHKPVFVFAIPRNVVAPIEISGFTYRPPVQLAACTYLLHHKPELYPQPHEFRPERFLGSGAQTRTWLPWGGGRKHCLGRHFAMIEVQTILRHVLSTRTVLPAASQIERPRWRSAILIPGAGGQAVLRARQQPHYKPHSTTSMPARAAKIPIKRQSS